MSSLKTLSLISMFWQGTFSPSISTPNTDEKFNNEVKALKSELAAEEKKEPALSKDLFVASRIANSSIEIFSQAFRRFKEAELEAGKAKAATFVVIPSTFSFPAGCRVLSSHPSGVERSTDNKYNGISLFVDCSDRFYLIEYSDFSQPLNQNIRKEMSENYYAIRGGFLSSSFALSDDGRSRKDFTAIGNSAAVDMVVQSKIALKQDAMSLAGDIDIIERLMAISKT